MPPGPAPQALPTRRLVLDLGDDLDVAWNHRFPELAFAANGVSLLMPYAEPYFVHTVRRALPDLPLDLQGPTADFCRQEAGHHRQHRRFNDLAVARVPSLGQVERWIARSYGWLDRTRSLRFNLAFAAASETIAFGIAVWSDDHVGEFFDGADPAPATLFLWHLAEEVEHKSAAHDAWAALDGSRLRYSAAMALTVSLLVWFTTLATIAQVAARRRWYHPMTWFRLLRWSLSLAFTLLPVMFVSCLPRHHPSDLPDPTFLPAWLRQFDPATGTLPTAAPSGHRPAA